MSARKIKALLAVLYACLSALVFRHAVEHADVAGGGRPRRSAAAVLDRCGSAAKLAGVVNGFDGDVGPACDAAESLGYGVNHHVVVFRNAMNGHGGIEDEGIELAVYERGGEGGLNRGGDHGSGLGLGRDDDFSVAPTVEKEVVFNHPLIDAVMQADRQNAPLKFFLRVLAIPIPNPHWSNRVDAEQVLPRRHCDGFNEAQRRLANFSLRGGDAKKLAGIVATVDELTAGER